MDSQIIAFGAREGLRKRYAAHTVSEIKQLEAAVKAKEEEVVALKKQVEQMECYTWPFLNTTFILLRSANVDKSVIATRAKAWTFYCDSFPKRFARFGLTKRQKPLSPTCEPRGNCF